MEMSNNSFSIPESLHVAQQRRRDKLRFQHFEELQANSNNFHNHNHNVSSNGNGNGNSNNVAPSSMMILSPEMFHFSPNHLSNIHPTRFIAPSSSDSCDTQQQHNWVPSFGMNQVDYNNNNNGSNQGDQRGSEIEYVQSWGGCGNSGSELALLPGNFVGHPLNEAIAASYNGNPRHGRGLSLSLSSNQIYGGEYQQIGELQQQQQQREMKPFESGGSISSSVMKLESGSSSHHVQDVVGGSSIQVHQRGNNVGPLGPFTGYSAILKSSKFLKPAQHLLDELFGAAAGVWRVGDGSDNDLNNSRSRDVGDCSTAMGSKNRGPVNDLSGRSGSCEESFIVPDCYERKAKLLHMQEEVCKRQKQYHQQMQMVLSAFESVPGLSNATPYISRSLKTISRHFRCLKNAIADQIKHLKRALGEDLSSPVRFLKGDSSSSMRFDRNFAKVKSGAGGGASHVWRPQRGLPERAVSVLRAWLFDHFLHPYPTDNDKQMLATQTGLTRNQVSNWFINARVRLWKPMVEEIHTLETKAPPRSEPSSSNSAMSAVIAKNRQLVAAGNKYSGCKPPLSPACDSKQLECSGPSNSLERSRGREMSTEQLFQKCSRIESNHQVPGSMDNNPFISFLPYQRRGLDLGEIGVVSLTLGLKHGSDTNQQQLQHQFIPQGVPFGGHVIHDFSG